MAKRSCESSDYLVENSQEPPPKKARTAEALFRVLEGKPYTRVSEFKEKYVIQQMIDKGSFGKVHKCMRKADNKILALKIVPKSKYNDAIRLQKEVHALQTLGKHPNVVELVEVVETKKQLIFVMELCEGKDLFYMLEGMVNYVCVKDGVCLHMSPGGTKFNNAFLKKGEKIEYLHQKGDWLKVISPEIGWAQIVKDGEPQLKNNKLTEADVSRIMKTLIETIKWMHDEGFVHRDLKPENILLKREGIDSPLKITDFGLVGDIDIDDEGRVPTGVGTIEYAAPETLNRDLCTKAVDIWSLGVIGFICLGGYPPFYGATRAVVIDRIKNGEYSFASPYFDEVSASAKDFLKKMLQVDPTERATAEQLLVHPFLVTPTLSQMGEGYESRIAAYNLKRRFRSGIRTIIAVNRLVDIMQELGVTISRAQESRVTE